MSGEGARVELFKVRLKLSSLVMWDVGLMMRMSDFSLFSLRSVFCIQDFTDITETAGDCGVGGGGAGFCGDAPLDIISSEIAGLGSR